MRSTSVPIAPVDGVQRDGATVRIRPATLEDRERVEAYLIDLSPESRRLRFHSTVVDVGEIAAQAVEVDPAINGLVDGRGRAGRRIDDPGRVREQARSHRRDRTVHRGAAD
jgi:hypothetical protein